MEGKTSFGKYMIFFIINALIFLNLITYNGSVHLTPFPAYFVDLILFIGFIAFYAKKKIPFPWTNKIFIWLIFYILVNLIYFIVSPEGAGEFKYFKIMIFFSFFVIYAVLFFNLDNEELVLTRKTMVILAIIATITLITDYVETGYFIKNFIDLPDNYVVGRAASFYLNANIAGSAMVVFLIYTIDVVPIHVRLPYIFILFLGLFATMSRSNIIVFMLVLMIMFFQKKLKTLHTGLFFVLFMLFFTWMANGGLEYLGDKFDFKVTENMINRVNFFAEKKKSDTSDMEERKRVLKIALEKFADAPIFGQGFATTRLWNYRVSPHNTLAVHWAEFGLFGVLIVPLLLYFATYDIRLYGTRNQKQTAILVTIFFLLSCFFSHNMLEQQLDVAAVVALSVMGYKSKQKYLFQRHKQR